MSSTGAWRVFTRNSASTETGAGRLRGRIYPIPFERVWRAALALAGGGLRGWRVLDADDLAGVIRAEATSLLFHRVADVEIRVGLDQDAQTRVDARSASRGRRGDLGASVRRLRRFLRRLDRALAAPAPGPRAGLPAERV